MVRTRITAVAAALTLATSVGVWAAGSQDASAQEPTPTRTPDLEVRVDGNRVSWTPFASAAEYRLTGTLLAIRVNASDRCLPPLTEDRRTVTVDETLGADATDFEVPLPPLPPEDGWLAASVSVTLRAFDAEGREIAAQGAASVAESECPPAADAMPQPTVSSLPTTGAGSAQGGGGRPALVLAAAGASLLTLATATRRSAA